MKYIPADKLIAEIERRIDLICTTEGVVQRDKLQEYEALRDIGDFIISLQQEQPEVQNGKFVFPKYLYARTKDNKTIDMSYAPQDMNAIEYIRNDFIQKEQPEVDLEKKMKESEQSWYNKAAEFWYKHCELNKTKDQRILILYAPTFTEFVHDIYEFGLNARKP